MVLAYRTNIWARPEQQIPSGNWRWLGLNAGRGWGKGHMVAPEINRRVREGLAVDIALVAPNEARADAVQIQFLIDTAPPWFRPERYDKGIRWPNGVRARVFTPEAPGRTRGGNFDLAWCTELVDWAAASRVKTWLTLSEAVRRGAAQLFWDSTNSGKNDLINLLEKQHTDFPARHLMQGGTTFDNPFLPRKYLQTVCTQYPKGSRRYREEILGESFNESAGALWQQKWIDDNRRPAMITQPVVRLVAWDPTMSARPEADEAGISMASADDAAHYYIELDLSGRVTMAEQAQRVCDACLQNRASGVVIERNHAGDGPHDLLVLVAAKHGAKVERLAVDRPFPPWRSGVIYVREYNASRSKAHRAEPVAGLAGEGRLHHVGYLDALELEMTTWEPDSRDSPNRLDAAAYAVAELAALGRLPTTVHDDMAAGARAHTVLRDRLRIESRGRRL